MSDNAGLRARASNVEDRIEASLDRLDAFVEARRFCAYDPGDGQMSFLRALTFGSRRMERVLTAVVLRAPFNIRPLLGIGPHTSTKGMGYMAWGYLKRFQRSGDRRDEERARMCLDWLLAHGSPDRPHLCWGNAFGFTTRAARIPAYAPTIVWSGLIGQAFVEASEILDDARYLDAAKSVCDWILTLPRERTSSGACLSYVEFDQVSIHNSNMLGAALLARVGALLHWPEAIDVAREAMRYSCARQNADGAWLYGEAEKFHWIDSFHTGYNLDSLKRYLDSVGEPEFLVHLSRGYTFFRNNFFEADGRVRYMHDRLLPIDIQCLAQSIDTLCLFAPMDPAAIACACAVADWTVRNMQDADGHFYYRDLGWTKNRTPMFHWGQGVMFKALANLSCALKAGRDQAAAVGDAA